MSIKTLTLLVASAMVVTVTSAMAADGKINFTGVITDNACTVTNHMANPLEVSLGTVSSSAFKAEGDRAAPTAFSILLTACPDTFKSASVKFDGTANSANNALLALTEGTGVAEGVGIQLTDTEDNEIPLHTASPSMTLSKGDNSLDFVARYYATQPEVKAGKADATTNFTIVYN